MNGVNDVVIVSGARTAVGDYGGSLKDIPPNELGTIVIKEAIKRASIAPTEVQQVVVGHIFPTQGRDYYVSRVASVDAGIPVESPVMQLNRLCGSSCQAVITAAQMLMTGDGEVAVAAGMENMSRAGYLLPALRWGARMNDTVATDMMVAGLTDPFGAGHMGVTAENVAERFGVTRQEQDELAATSHQRAWKAINEGRFKSQIVPIEIKVKKAVKVFDTDEHVRSDVTAESLAKLQPVFKKGGTVTAGNASGLNDCAAAVVLMTAEAAKKRNAKPMARIVSWGIAGVPPEIMGIGPVKAVPIAMQRAGLTVNDMDVIECNEAFAAQAAYCARELGLPKDKTNPNGSGISIGHPVGATGALLVVKLIHELERIKGRYGLVTMCIGGGQGIALIVERMG